MRILIIGDVIGPAGIEFLKENLARIKRRLDIDFCIANGENSANNGITVTGADGMLGAGVDAITLGNHAFDKIKEAETVLESGRPVVRPSNYPLGTAGAGYIVVDVGEVSVAVVNAMGRAFMEPLDCPFQGMNALLRKLDGAAQVVIVDFHAEATSEKLAMLHHLDGRVTAVVGTHTHVQTADERVTKQGTAYITDLGMTGPVDSILGVGKDSVLARFVTRLHHRYGPGEGEIELCGVIVEADENTGKAIGIERIAMR